MTPAALVGFAALLGWSVTLFLLIRKTAQYQEADEMAKELFEKCLELTADNIYLKTKITKKCPFKKHKHEKEEDALKCADAIDFLGELKKFLDRNMFVDDSEEE